ncbi:MAG: VWA domain-containing protein, partial [Acidimicrobiia bacterium]
MAERPERARAAVGFVRVLRAAGIGVSTDSSVLFCDALARVGWARADDVYWAARATLCRRPEDTGSFDLAFRSWFSGTTDGIRPAAAPSAHAVIALDLPDTAGRDVDPDEGASAAPVRSVRFSRAEVLGHQDFATYSPAEHAEARRLLADLRVAGARRRSRRLVQTRARRRPDVRRTVRASMRTGGEPVVRAYRRPSERSRRLVLLCDVSGSMEPYARVIVRFLHSAVVARTQVE